MGRTFTANKPLPLNNSPKQLSVSWESNPARVIAREKKYLVQIVEIFDAVQDTVTRSIGLVVTPDWFGETALGSSLHSTKG
jgi:hypothetical protein